MRLRGTVLAAGAALTLTSAACSSPSYAPAAGYAAEDEAVHEAPEPNYTADEQYMVDLGETIDSWYGIETYPDVWLSLRENNCDVARRLGDADPSSVTWYVPPQKPTTANTLLDDESLLGAAVAISLVSGCTEAIDYSWRWPSFWATIQVLGDSGDSGGSGPRVQCEDGSWSSSGGTQGACSWHGGVDDYYD